ncbi:MAG: TonB-dependent siderophore receptor [Gammaproteobacteria bacterium]|nr:TonB-dependent siderophore receptor [Gammaproteobacteria bacterium]
MHAFPSRRRRAPLVLAVAAALLPVAGQASSAPGNSPIPVIEVIGRGEQAIARQPGTVVILEREDIEILQPLSTEDALRRVPGVNAKSEEETSVVANIGIRGLSAGESKSLILEDGVPVAPGLFIGNDRYFNPRIQRIERIEVLKGSASLRYGPSTIGGVINFQTKTPDDGVLVSARAGSFDARELMLEAGARTASGDGFGGVVATYARSDGFMDKGYEMIDVMAKAGMALGDRQSLGFKFSYHENDANISYRGLLLDDYRAGATYNPAPDDYYLTDRTAFDINHQWDLNDRVTLSTLVYWSDMTRDYWRYNVDTAASNAAGRWVFTDALTGNNRSFERYGIDSRLKFDHGLFGIDSQAEVGVRALREESDDTRIRATRAQDRTGINDRHIVDAADSVALYLQNRFEISERLAVTPGLRVESYEQTRRVLTDNNASARTSNSEVLPGVGATFWLTPSAQLYGGVYRAFAPASNGVALDGLTDQRLEAERSTNFELGIRGLQDRLSYELAAFRMDFANQVVTGNSDPNLSQSNAGETLHQGAELSVGYELGGGLSLAGNLTWVPTSRFETGENAGNRIPYSPKVLANVGMDYTQGAFRGALMAHHRGSQFGDGTNLREIPANAAGGIWGGEINAYTVFDATAQYRLGEHWTFFGAVKNLADKRYITGFRQGIYVGPERSYELGLSYRL